jgi:hypothetical protein
MKRQNLVMLTGRLADYAEQTAPVGGQPAYVITATLVTDHPAYGGHHRVLFADRLALELRAFREVSQGASLEVTVDGWLRSQPAGAGGAPPAVVVADRVMYHVSDAVRQEAGRLTARLLALTAPRR